MEKISIISISVRNLVEFVMRSGDINAEFSPTSRMNEGSRIHKKLQKLGGDNYEAEVYIKLIVERSKNSIEVNGRIDGVISEDNKIIINEIKTVSLDVNKIEKDFDEKHWAQLKCYAYMYAQINKLDKINIRLTYCNSYDFKLKNFDEEYGIEDLQGFFYKLIDEYLVWANFIKEWEVKRNQSIKLSNFPFEKYRAGQRELAVSVYRCLRDEKRMFVCAPTGIGKTSGVLFPAIKALGEGITSKIFYITARTTNRKIAEDTIKVLRSNGMNIKSIILTAKDKICFNPNCSCKPDECEYAKGHFDRVNEALKKLVEEDSISKEIVEEISKEYKVCPFELSLDAAIFADVVICDYNYVFDPSASLKRFFMDNKTDYSLLIDEAHNLVDRGREMFSSKLSKRVFLNISKEYKSVIPEISECAKEINKEFIKYKKNLKNISSKTDILLEPPEDLCKILRKFIAKVEENSRLWHTKMDREKIAELLNLYFECQFFLKIYEIYNKETYRTYIEIENGDLYICMMCVNPSNNLREIMNKVKSTILFSATLTPMEYYMDILGGTDGAYSINIPSPFPPENFLVMIDDTISTKYKDRDFSYDLVARDIISATSQGGNYLVFFPSYKYMNEVYKRFEELPEKSRVIIQKSDMSEEEREEFLNNFSEKSEGILMGFSVMGGIFGEGIDLTGDRLKGAIIVGVGLPQLCNERNIIKQFYDEKSGTGFEYAYIYPGMNRVLQAAGRVIRTENDRGILLLIDNRFLKRPYREIIPKHWKHIVKIKKPEQVEYFIKDFKL